MLKDIWKKEGERNATVASVKYFQVQSNKRPHHLAVKFALVTISSLDNTVAIIFGQKQVVSHCQEDKTKEALGLPPISKWVSILMQLWYEVCVPNQKFNVA